MSAEFRLPQISDSDAAAKVAVWLKREGDRVNAGEPLVEVETDKTNMEVESPASGVLEKLYAAPGAEVHAGDLLAVISEAGERRSEPVEAPTPKSEQASASHKLETPPVAQVVSKKGPAPELPTAPRPKPSASVTPLAQAMAVRTGLNVESIHGSGPGGRILKSDVERALGKVELAPRQPPPRQDEPSHARLHEQSRPRGVEQPLTPMRRVTAERLLASKQTIPHFYLEIECAADKLLEARTRINAAFGTQITVTDIIVRAAAAALRRVPAANASWSDQKVHLHDTIDIAVAVATPGGLIAPVIRQADQKSLAAISEELRSLSERARAGKLAPTDYSGGTFTISNLGMYGISSLYAIINPPQCCILGIGAIERRPVVRDDQVAVGAVMRCTLSADHRIIDGAVGAELLSAFRTVIEDPVTLVL